MPAPHTNDVVRIEVEHASELASVTPRPSTTVRRLEVVEAWFADAPCDRAGRTVELQPLLDAFPSLTELYVRAHVFPTSLAHPRLERAEIDGTVGLTPLDMPALRSLRLSVPGDEQGAPPTFEDFAWLLAADGLPALEELDVRGLDAEPSKSRPSVLARWAGCPLLPRLRRLGIDGTQTSVSELKKRHEAFAHLEVLVVAQLLSAGDRNPIKKNVRFESELEEVPLAEVAHAIDALPDVSALKPSLSEAAYDALFAAVDASPIRYPERALASMVGRFVKRGQWSRVEALLELAKRKAPHRRAFMNVREAAQAHVATYLAKKPGDEVASRLHERLEAQNSY